jgi:hypothetical protein
MCDKGRSEKFFMASSRTRRQGKIRVSKTLLGERKASMACVGGKGFD